MIKKVNIIGAGNVGTHLAKQLSKCIEVCNVFSLNIKNAKTLAGNINAIPIDDLTDLNPNVDLNIIALRDDAIQLVLNKLPLSIPVVHTSGSVGLEVLTKFSSNGILYPLQTFSKKNDMTIEGIPFLLEANSKSFEKTLLKFTKSCLSSNVHLTNSNIRSEIHLAAVVSNNFMTHLLLESESILKRNDIPLDILKPLMEETLKKVFESNPKEAQTGPAKRKDEKVINLQMNKITDPKFRKVYKLLSELIGNQED